MSNYSPTGSGDTDWLYVDSPSPTLPKSYKIFASFISTGTHTW